MPASYIAYEVRWFGYGQMPEVLVSQFERIQDHEMNVNHEIRTDVYFAVEGKESIGIKLRGAGASEEDGKLEIKTLTNAASAPLVVGGSTGRAEEWTKIGWEFPGSDQSTLARLLDRGYGVHKVHVWKDRLQWKFEPSEATTPVALKPKERRDRACMAELTNAKIFSEPAEKESAQVIWSVAIEAFDDKEGKRLEALSQGLRQVFSGYEGKDLGLENSYGYPRQLLHCVASDGES
jgi:hypothetical protein